MKGPNYEDIIWNDEAEQPSQETLDGLRESVETEIALENQSNSKVAVMQTEYHPQLQMIEIMKAIRDNDNTTLLEMLNFWESL